MKRFMTFLIFGFSIIAIGMYRKPKYRSIWRIPRTNVPELTPGQELMRRTTLPAGLLEVAPGMEVPAGYQGMPMVPGEQIPGAELMRRTTLPADLPEVAPGMEKNSSSSSSSSRIKKVYPQIPEPEGEATSTAITVSQNPEILLIGVREALDLGNERGAIELLERVSMIITPEQLNKFVSTKKRTLLMQAAEKGHLKVVQKLLELRADPEVTMPGGETTAFDLADRISGWEEVSPENQARYKQIMRLLRPSGNR